MAFRLGTWCDESQFQRLEELLSCAVSLTNWKHEKSLLYSADYAEFWSLVWQLQVAEHLCQVGTDVSWAKSGPDLSVKVGDECWFVECYTYRKSFGLLGFLRDLLEKISPAVRISYDLCLPFKLPRDKERIKFLDEILSPFLDPAYLTGKKEEAKQQNPVILYKDPCSSLRVYVKLDDGECTQGIIPGLTPRPKSYVEDALKKAVKAKRGKNALATHRPNLLVVSFLLSDDYQLAEIYPEMWESLALPEIAPDIDALAVSTVGIDAQLTKEKLKVVRVNGSHHVNHENLDCIAALN